MGFQQKPSAQAIEQCLETFDTSDVGFIVECDLKFPQKIPDKFNQFPLIGSVNSSIPHLYEQENNCI